MKRLKLIIATMLLITFTVFATQAFSGDTSPPVKTEIVKSDLANSADLSIVKEVRKSFHQPAGENQILSAIELRKQVLNNHRSRLSEGGNRIRDKDI